MKKLFFLFLFVSPNAFAATPVKLVDGSPQFAIATLDGVPAYSSQELTALQVTNPSGVLVNYTPTFFETAVSTTIVTFSGADDFRSCLTSKTYITTRVLTITDTILAYQAIANRYPGLAPGINARISKLVAQGDLLIAVYLSLP